MNFLKFRNFNLIFFEKCILQTKNLIHVLHRHKLKAINLEAALDPLSQLNQEVGVKIPTNHAANRDPEVYQMKMLKLQRIFQGT